MTADAAAGDLAGVYRIEFEHGARRSPVGIVRLSDGRLEGTDLRNLSYEGTYRVDGPRGDVVVEGRVKVPPRTRLAGDIVSSDEATEVPIALRLPAAAASGGAVAVDVALDAVHSSDRKLGPVRARFLRIGDA